MQPRKLFWRLAALTVLVLPSVLATDASGQTLKQVTKFDLPGPGGKRFDYLTIDADDRYLISAHLAADSETGCRNTTRSRGWWCMRQWVSVKSSGQYKKEMGGGCRRSGLCR